MTVSDAVLPETGQAPEGSDEEQPQEPDQPDGTETPDGPDPEQLQAELTRARRDASKYRRQLRDLQGKQPAEPDADALRRKVIEAIGPEGAKALGIDPATPVADTESARRLIEVEADRRQAKVETAVVRQAAKLGADGDALLDSRAFLASLTDLDPSEHDFADQVAGAIKDTLKSSPQYRSGQAPKPPARSGGNGQFGAPGGQRQWTAQQVKAASPAQLLAANKSGLLREYFNTPGPG